MAIIILKLIKYKNIAQRRFNLLLYDAMVTENSHVSCSPGSNTAQRPVLRASGPPIQGSRHRKALPWGASSGLCPHSTKKRCSARAFQSQAGFLPSDFGGGGTHLCPTTTFKVPLSPGPRVVRHISRLTSLSPSPSSSPPCWPKTLSNTPGVERGQPSPESSGRGMTTPERRLPGARQCSLVQVPLRVVCLKKGRAKEMWFPRAKGRCRG